MSAAWSLIGLLMVGGCTQQHFSIGVAEDAEERDAVVDSGEITTTRDASAEAARPSLDASEKKDASEVRDARATDAWMPLDLKLRVFDREDVATIRAGCQATCADFEAVPRGGTPPYRLLWIDGNTASKRTFCPGADELTLGITLSPLVTVQATDSAPTDAGQAFAETSIFLDGCDAGVANWELCVRPTPSPAVSCPNSEQTGSWFALAEPVDEANATVSAVISGATPLTPMQVELWLASEPCGNAVHVATATVDGLNTTVRGDVMVRGARYVLMRGVESATGLTVSDLRVCLQR